ncbi:MAG: hypothetical protein U5L96_19690 [Owenweeksia sp.]|nr:hypothetical protein [Owenweeksia sp.]
MAEIKLNEWIYEPGLPNNLPEVPSEKFAIVDSVLTAFIENGSLPEGNDPKLGNHSRMVAPYQITARLTIPKSSWLRSISNTTLPKAAEYSDPVAAGFQAAYHPQDRPQSVPQGGAISGQVRRPSNPPRPPTRL